MHTPYTTDFPNAYGAAHTAIVVALSAFLWGQPERRLVSRAAMQAGIAVVAVAPWTAETLAGLGFHPTPLALVSTLRWAALLATVATALDGRWGPVVWAAAGEAALWFLTGYLTNSSLELVELHAAFLGLLVGLHRAPPAGIARVGRHDLDRRRASDWLVFGTATLLGAVTCVVVLQRRIGSSDEWAYTYQAAVFAKLHAYATDPPCSYAFQNFWVFPYMGRQFSQYTPGWPYFMAPFVLLRAAWLAGPVCFGLLAAGIARLARRAMALADGGRAPRRTVEAAGWFAALATMASSTLLINGGSRFSHEFVLVLFVWAVEALLLLADPHEPPPPERARFWAVVLGACSALLLATRPADGAGLGIGMFLYFVYALAKRRFSALTVLAVAVPFAAIGGLTLVILRLQLGRWFVTGYSLNSLVHPWNKLSFSTPTPDQWRWGFPLATGSYCWWPCSLALGLGGLASLGRRGRALNVVLFLGIAPVLVFYAFLTLGRGFDWGYGPRYQMIAMVPMALGTGVVLARLLERTTRRVAFGAALAAVVVGVVRIAPLVFPYEHKMVADLNRLDQAIVAAHLHHALVIAEPGTAGVDPMDLTQNLPLDLYPNQNVIVGVSRTPALEKCARAEFPDRAVYDARGRVQVTLRRVR